jgi:hypothetical protein
LNQTNTRVFVKGTLSAPPERRRRGAKQIYKHFAPSDSLYYKEEGKYYCICDDLPARGFAFKDEAGKERFLPHDFDDLISHEEARRLCRKSEVYFPQPERNRDGHRVPPPLIWVSTPDRRRPAWNRSAIIRHIEESIKRKSEHARLH